VIEETLQQYKIPYEIQNGLCFYDRREVKILLDYLRFIADPNSDAGDEALRNVINTVVSLYRIWMTFKAAPICICMRS